MKKILLFIVGIFGIFSFCFGSSICSNSFNIGSESVYNNNSFNLILSGNLEDFTFYSFSSSPNTFYFTGADINICYATGTVDFFFFNVSVNNYIREGFICDTYSVSVDGSTITFNTPFRVPSSTTYLAFYLTSYPQQRTVMLGQSGPDGENIPLTDSFSLFNTWSSSLYLTEICYSEPVTSPKFIVNYGSTSYEYELEDNLSIYLKSPVFQSGDIFTYNGPTGINLFYNDTFQFYSKDKLYLKSMYWYNKNIFTPICL